jgi:hypothetical protein
LLSLTIWIVTSYYGTVVIFELREVEVFPNWTILNYEEGLLATEAECWIQAAAAIRPKLDGIKVGACLVGVKDVGQGPSPRTSRGPCFGGDWPV